MSGEVRPPSESFRRFCECLYTGVAVRFIGLDDLIVNKRAAGRAKDLADVEALERARASKNAE